MDIDSNKYERIIEITFYEVVSQIRTAVPTETYFLFLESFCRTFDIDYTEINAAINFFFYKIRPTKRQRTMFAVFTGTKLTRLGYDYRTIRKYRREYERGEFEFYPLINNPFMLEDMRRFVISYLKLFPIRANFMFDFVREGGLDYEIKADIYGGDD